MKSKFLLILIAIALCLSLASCTLASPGESSTPKESSSNPAPESTPEATPEATPESTPESTPAETPEDPGEDEAKLAQTLAQLDAVCKEQLILTEGTWKVEYRYIQSYYGEIAHGHVFMVYIWRQFDWGEVYSETVGDYYFKDYYGGSRNNYIYIYDGEKLIHLPDAYNDNLVSGEELEFIYNKYVEQRITEHFMHELKFSYDSSQDLTDKYEVSDTVKIAETSNLIAYIIKVSPKDSKGIFNGESLTVGQYEFTEYGENGFIYVFDKKHGTTRLNHIYDRLKNYEDPKLSELESLLPEIMEYWENNCVKNK